jgi:uncharacterized protein (DUF983 family)
MKFSFTKNPNNLPCPKCGELVKFEVPRNISCPSCDTKLEVDKKSTKLQSLTWILFCSPALVFMFIDFPENYKWFASIILWIAALIILGVSNAEAKLIENK